MATYEDIVASKDAVRAIVSVPTPEWGGTGTTHLVALDGTCAGKAMQLAEKIRGMRKNITEEASNLASWVVLGMCDKKGKRMLKESQSLCLLDGPLAPLQRCGIRCAELNGLTVDLEKNSEATTGASSRSG